MTLRSAVVLGFGRSGTSLVAGLLVDAGLRPPARTLPASAANPTGYVEDPEINRLNDELLLPHLGMAHARTGSRLAWLADIDPSVPIVPTADQRRRMAALVPAPPFCVKDPRFCHTLQAWRPTLGTSAVLVVFRNPAAVVRSIQREVERDAEYHRGFDFTPEAGYEAWYSAHRRVLASPGADRFAYVDADVLARTGGVRGLERTIGGPVPADRLRPGLLHPPPSHRGPTSAEELHAELVARAEATLAEASPRS